MNYLWHVFDVFSGLSHFQPSAPVPYITVIYLDGSVVQTRLGLGLDLGGRAGPVCDPQSSPDHNTGKR